MAGDDAGSTAPELIVIGGFENTGTRLVVQALERVGYEGLEPRNQFLDYMGHEILPVAAGLLQGGDASAWVAHLRERLEEARRAGKRRVIAKHGHYCMAFDQLRRELPEARLVLCWRDTADSLAKASANYSNVGRLRKPHTTAGKFGVYRWWYRPEARRAAHAIVKLERMLADAEGTFGYLLRALGLPAAPGAFEGIVGAPSKTVGAGRAALDAPPETLREIEAFGRDLDREIAERVAERA